VSVTPEGVDDSLGITHAYERKTFCAICEAGCGLIATVEHGQVTALRPDGDHPTSQGFACAKGVEFHNVVSDPDRVLYPMRRVADGSFERASCDEALDDIGRRLRRVRRWYGQNSIGVAFGNPAAFNFAGSMSIMGLARALKTKHHYGSASVDINNYHAACDLLYGSTMANPVPDLVNTDFALIVGANPVVSKGSMVTVGRIREVLVDIRASGGRVVVVDPRRTETAKLFEHVPIRPNADPWPLGAMLRVLFEDDLLYLPALTRQATGLDQLRDLAFKFDLDRSAREAGVDVETITELARALAKAPRACVYGRCGASLGRYSTLTKYLLDTLAIATGNLDRRGGLVFGDPAIDFDSAGAKAGIFGRNRWRTRVADVGEVNTTAPLACLADEITTPGEGKLRALIGLSINPVTSSPASVKTAAALDELDLMVALDPYITETSRHAHWILPPALWLEREQVPFFTQAQALIPHAQWVAPVVAPRGEAREDWWILDQIARRIGLPIVPIPGGTVLAKFGIRLRPQQAMDLLLRTGKNGDWFGVRRNGLSRRKLIASSGAVKLADSVPVGVLRDKLGTKDRRVHLGQPEMLTEVDRLVADEDDMRYPLRLFSVRQLRSHNTWLHNVPRLMAGGRGCHAIVNPRDAHTAGVHDRDPVTIASPWGQITVPALVSDEVTVGAVGLTHGYGHAGGWRRAVDVGGASYNELTPSDAFMIDRPSGNAFLNGIAVSISPADPL
jgi:anaerobic selenocysteine-containing dehydrogenase